MRPADEAIVTTTTRPIGAPDVIDSVPGGVWTLAGDRLIIAEPGGPATVLAPSEQVRLLTVELPLANRAKRVEALPFAIEDRIADPLNSVHLATGAEIAPKTYLVGVVRHEVMESWVEAAELAGLGHAALVPDALALPRPAEGEWAVELTGDRALVRSGDGAGFAAPTSLLKAAWEAAGRPACRAYGAPLPDEMMAGGGAVAPEALAVRLLAPALDLRQGVYARRSAPLSSFWRRLGWIAAIGVAAHVVIALADTLMLSSIADRREAEARELVAAAAPGANLSGDLGEMLAERLPAGSNAPPDRFLPLISRLSGALSPVSGSLAVRAMTYQANTLTIDLDGTDTTLAPRIEAALRSAQVAGGVTRGADGSIRITARAA